MSFYGNSYHYTAESFAKVVLKNSGIGRYLTDPPSGYVVVPQDSDYELSAIHREEGLGIQSGNHWIKLASNQDSFQVLHNAPGPQEKLVLPFGIASDEEKKVIGDVNNNNILKFDDVLIIPTISYDAAGHITTVEGAAIYQMPSNPVTDLTKEMESLSAEVDEAVKSVNDTAASLDGKLEKLDQAVSDASSAKYTANQALEAASDITIKSTTIYEMQRDISQLKTAVEELQKKN